MNIIFSVLWTIVQVIGLIFFKFFGWVPVVLVLLYLWWQNRRRSEWVSSTDHILLLIEVPKDNEKKELSAEQMFASLHGILRPKSELRAEGSLQEHISFEIAAKDNVIQFYVWTPRHLKDFVEGQIYAQYPTVHIREGAEDYSRTEIGDRGVYGTELTLTKSEVLPIRVFASFEVDPLAGITAVLAKLEEPGEELWVQVLARPTDDSWQDKGTKYVSEVKSGKAPTISKSLIDGLLNLPIYIIMNFFNALVTPPGAAKDDKKKDDKKVELSTGQQTVIKAVEEKITKLGYEVKIRICYLGPDQSLSKQRMQAIVGGFKQFNTTNLNGFEATKYGGGEEFIQQYKSRFFFDSGYILNIEELASLYHLPHKSVETPNMAWTTTKTSEPPSNLPTEKNTDAEDLSLFGITNFRGGQKKFGIKRLDRGRHMYIVGQTGAGKSGLLKLLSLSDVYHNQGMAIIDPHGDFATDMLQFIPEHRLKDVIYMNPSDTEFPIAFNPLEVYDDNLKPNVSSEVIGVLKRMFDSWGPRLEYILRFTLLALLDYPDSTMLGITRMLTEKDFRKKVIAEIKDPIVRNFWVTEYASWNEKFATEAVAPVLNKVGAFISNPLVRNIIGQPKSAFDMRSAMDEGKILVVNLSRGLMGEDNASILGALMVTKIQLAALSRANIALEDRKPFYLYVDEFQNFATDSFAVILSEARKYGLNLTVANQYIGQMPETVRDAVFGNVGSMITFRAGADDATYLAKYYTPAFEAEHIMKLNNQDIYISMIIEGEKTLPFSGKTLRLPEPAHDMSAQIIHNARTQYASPRAVVEEKISAWSSPGGDSPHTDTAAGQIITAQPLSNESDALLANHEEQKPNKLDWLKNPDLPSKPTPTTVHSGQSREQGSQNRGQGNRDRGRNDNRNRNKER